MLRWRTRAALHKPARLRHHDTNLTATAAADTLRTVSVRLHPALWFYGILGRMRKAEVEDHQQPVSRCAASIGTPLAMTQGVSLAVAPGHAVLSNLTGPSIMHLVPRPICGGTVRAGPLE